MGKKKKHTRNQGVGGGGGEQQWNEGEVDALTEALGFAFPPGAVRDVLAQCGGDVGRALDVLLAQEAAVPAFNDSPTPAYGVEEEEEEEEGKAIAESGSSSPSTSSSPSRTKEAFKGERGSPAAAEAEAEADGIDDGGHDDGGMVTVSAASKADVARYMAKAAGAGRPASPAPSSPQRPPEGVEGEVDGGGGGGDADGMGSLCLWELLKTMFIDMLPEGALGATYAHHHRGGGAGGGEGDLVAMVEEAARMLANEQEEVEDEEEEEDYDDGAAAAGPPPLTLPSAADREQQEDDDYEEEEEEEEEEEQEDGDEEEGEEETGEEEEEYDEGLAALKILFPSLPRPFLRATLARFDGDVDAAAYDLLGGSPPDSSAAASAAAAATAAARSSPPPRAPSRQQRRARSRPKPLRQVLFSNTTTTTSASPWAPINPAPSPFALSPPSSSLAGATAAAIRGNTSSGGSGSGTTPLFAPSVHSTAAFPHLPASPKPTTTTTTTTNPGSSGRRRLGGTASAAATSSSNSSSWMAVASRRLAWLEEVYGAEFDKTVIRCLATEVHDGDIAAVEASLAEMDPRGFGRCRKARENRAKEAALLRAFSDASSSSSTTTLNGNDDNDATTIIRPHLAPLAPPTPGGDGAHATAAACRKRAEAERLAMLDWFRRAGAAYNGGGGSRAVAAQIAEGGSAHRRNMYRADAEAAANHLRAQSAPPLEVAVVDGGLPGVAVVRARADADGELRVDFHGLKVREAATHSLAPLLAPARIRTVRIVTGRGTHSRQGKARLGPAVLRALESYTYLRATPDSSGGAIVVRVRAGQRG